MRTTSALLLTLVLASCASDKEFPTDDFSSLDGLDEKSDDFSRRMTIVGRLDTDEPSAPVRYTRNPRYRAFVFDGAAGDELDIWVRSDDGDAVAWVVDSRGRILASNDDADETTFDAHITVTLPDSTNRRTHYVVFREYSLRSARFTVQLQHPDATCTVTAICVEGWHWDDEACACVRD